MNISGWIEAENVAANSVEWERESRRIRILIKTAFFKYVYSVIHTMLFHITNVQL